MGGEWGKLTGEPHNFNFGSKNDAYNGLKVDFAETNIIDRYLTKRSKTQTTFKSPFLNQKWFMKMNVRS